MCESKMQRMVILCVCFSHAAITDSLRPHGLQPSRLLCPWNSPGKNTGVGSHSLLPGIFLTQGWEPRSPAFKADSLPSEPAGKPLFPVNANG